MEAASPLAAALETLFTDTEFVFRLVASWHQFQHKTVSPSSLATSPYTRITAHLLDFVERLFASSVYSLQLIRRTGLRLFATPSSPVVPLELLPAAFVERYRRTTAREIALITSALSTDDISPASAAVLAAMPYHSSTARAHYSDLLGEIRARLRPLLVPGRFLAFLVSIYRDVCFAHQREQVGYSILRTVFRQVIATREERVRAHALACVDTSGMGGGFSAAQSGPTALSPELVAQEQALKNAAALDPVITFAAYLDILRIHCLHTWEEPAIMPALTTRDA